jgi:His/Glu/Gln/Arg/opine family amino acid ABC transporter permease subunit
MIELQGFGDQIAAGAITTLRVAATSLVLGIGVGLCGAMAKLSRFHALRRLADVYTTIIRGVPELLIILILYFGGTVAMTAAFGRYVEIDAFAAGVFALTIVFGAYATEVFARLVEGAYLAIGDLPPDVAVRIARHRKPMAHAAERHRPHLRGRA